MAQTINADDGVISGSAGLKSSSDGTAILSLQTKGTTALTVDGSQNVGIGVTPSAWQSTRRVVQVGANGGALWGINSGAGTCFLSNNTYYDGTNYKYINTANATYYAQASDGKHEWHVAGSGTAGNNISFTQAMTLNASGELLLEGADPAVYVKPSTTTKNAYLRSVNAGGTGYIGLDNSSGGLGGAYALNIWHSGNYPIVFGTNNTERARITSDGDFLVGTTSSICTGTFSSSTSSRQLAVTGANQNGIRFASATGGSGWIIGRSLFANNSNDFFIYDHANDIVRVFVSADGEVRIAGTADQGAYNLQVNGTGVWGAGAYVNGSDERLKDNIQSLDSGLDVVKAMRPVTFQYKPEHSKDQSVQPGFIAQELQQAMAGKAYLDGVVQSGPEYLNVAYQNIIPILTKAIQEQQDMINELKAKVAALETK